MNHQKKNNKLGRNAAHRKALLRNLGIALILHKRIRTTLPKAKELRKFIEPIITKAREGTTHAARYAFARLQNKKAVKELMNVVVPAVKDRPGGYTRIFKLGFRKGDNAHMCLIELVDFNNTYQKVLKKRKKKVRRGKGKKKSPEVQPTTVYQEVEPPQEETPSEGENQKSE